MILSKVCSRCDTDKTLDCFYKDKTGKHGTHSICKTCMSNKNKETYKINTEKIKERANEWLKNNPERGKEIRKKSAQKPENVKRSNAYNKKRRKEKPHIDKEYRETHKKERNDRDKERRHTDPLYNFSHKMTVMLGNIFKNKGYKKDFRKTEEILGCTIEYFIKYLEEQWSLPQNLNEDGQVWMTWNNHGLYNGKNNYGWDKDHRTPLSSAKTVEELVKLNHFTNLQPLCSKVNRDIKKNKLF